MRDLPLPPAPSVEWYFRSDDHSRPKASVPLTREQEGHLFLQYNYSRWRLSRAKRSSERTVWETAVKVRRDLLVAYNLALVVAMVHRTAGSGNPRIDEIVANCNECLLNSIEGFDVSKGFKFSTYASRSIVNTVIRSYQKTEKRREVALTEAVPNADRGPGAEEGAISSEMLEHLKFVLPRAPLTDRERAVIRMRYLDNPTLTLEQAGDVLGLTKERIRQIQVAAVDVIREAWYALL